MTNTLGKIIADFNAVLSLKVAVGATTATISTATDDDGVSLPAGNYFFTIDRNSSSKEYIYCALSGTSLSSIQSVSRQGVLTSGFARSHRAKTATVEITDFASLKSIADYLSGATSVSDMTFTDLSFTGTTTGGLQVKSLTTGQRDVITNTNNGQLIYNTTAGEFQARQGGVWATVSSGSTQPNASTTVAGKVEIATSAESIAGTDTGGTGALLSVLPSDIAKNAQSGTFVYGVDTGGDDTYVVALTPALTVYTTGQTLSAKMTTANTGACTIDFGPGVKSVKLQDGTDPLDGAIGANKIHDFIYDGTNLVIQNPFTATYDVNTTFTAGETITAGKALHTSQFGQTDGGILVDNSAGQNGSGSTLSLTVGSGSNRFLLVTVHASACTAVTYGGVAMTLVTSISLSGTLFLWKLKNPNSGANSISVTGTSINSITGVSFTGVNQTTELGTPVSNSAAASSLGVSVSGSAGGNIFSTFVMSGLSGTQTGNFTFAGSKYVNSIQPTNTATAQAASPQSFCAITGTLPDTTSITITGAASGSGGGSPSCIITCVNILPATAISNVVQQSNSSAITFLPPKIDFIGFANASASAGASVSVKSQGIVTGLAGLTPGAKYYLQDTSGNIGTSRGTYGKIIGVALSSTTLLIATEKTTGAAISKTVPYTYTAETDGTIVAIGGALNITADSVNYTSNYSVPVSKGKTYSATTGPYYFIPQA